MAKKQVKTIKVTWVKSAIGFNKNQGSSSAHTLFILLRKLIGRQN